MSMWAITRRSAMPSNLRTRVDGTHGHSKATTGVPQERQEGAGGREAEANAEEAAEQDQDGARQGVRGRAARRRADTQGARSSGPQARNQGPFEDGQGRAEARGVAREVTRRLRRL